ncbi:MAG: ATP-binding cassette domain-containing protein, partial [Desulfobacterales bacterium]|nr:ATP-binding cassette domain-containing protein [Desulfobacterales bacterium]
MSASFILELKDISKNFGGVRALHNVHLNLGYKEILAIVGDNGAGKSTLMKIISGAILPDSGNIFFEG